MTRTTTAATTRSLKPAAHVMRAATIAAPRSLTFSEQPLAGVGPHQVLIRVEGCGVCGSNIPVWEGRPWFEYPREAGSPGHEGWGAVAEVGDQVDHLEVGQRVTMLSYHAFAEFDVAEADNVVPLPAECRDIAFPGEPLACAVNVARRSDFQSGQTVAIVGIGFLGALLIQLANRAGAEVIAISRRETALEAAEQCGARHCVRFNDPSQVVHEVRSLTGGKLCPLAIEAAGKQPALDAASELVANRGRFVVAGFHQDGPRSVNMQSWNWRGIDVVNAHEREAAVYVSGMQAAVELAATGVLDLEPLLTHWFAFEELDRALDTSIDRPAGFLKSMIRFDGC